MKLICYDYTGDTGMDSRLSRMEDILTRLDNIVIAQDRMIAEIKTHIRPYKSSLKFYDEEEIGKVLRHIIPYKEHHIIS